MKNPKTSIAASEEPVEAADASAPKPPAGVLERGISILECFREDRLRMSLRELAECTGLD